MTTRITQIDDQASERTTLRVEGSLYKEDAEVLASTYTDLAGQAGKIAIDLSNINFIDSESASILLRLQELGVELVGLHFFVQRILQTAEGFGE